MNGEVLHDDYKIRARTVKQSKDFLEMAKKEVERCKKENTNDAQTFLF